MSALYAIASSWETISEEERAPLRERITRMVGYPCKLSCQPNNGTFDIYIYSVKAKCVTDWIAIQQNGALGALFDMYPPNKQPNRLSDACEDYNGIIGAEYVSDSDSEGNVEEEGEGESEGEGEGEYEGKEVGHQKMD